MEQKINGHICDDVKDSGASGSRKHHNHRKHSPRNTGLCIICTVQCLGASIASNNAKDDKSMNLEGNVGESRMAPPRGLLTPRAPKVKTSLAVWTSTYSNLYKE